MPTDSSITSLLPGAWLPVGTLLGIYVKWLLDRRKQNHVEQSSLLEASEELRVYVKSLFEQEREQHLREKEALLKEIVGLKDRILDLELRRREDETLRTQMAEKEITLLRQIGDLTRGHIEAQGTINELRRENEGLKREIHGLESKVAEMEGKINGR